MSRYRTSCRRCWRGLCDLFDSSFCHRLVDISLCTWYPGCRNSTVKRAGNLLPQNENIPFYHTSAKSIISKMTTIDLIKEAITALKDRTGSSVVAITKFIESEKKVRRLGRYIVFFGTPNLRVGEKRSFSADMTHAPRDSTQHWLRSFNLPMP